VERPPGHLKLVADHPELHALRKGSPAPQGPLMNPVDRVGHLLLLEPSGERKIVSKEPSAEPFRGVGREESLRVVSLWRMSFVQGVRRLVRGAPHCSLSNTGEDFQVRDRSHL